MFMCNSDGELVTSIIKKCDTTIMRVATFSEYYMAKREKFFCVPSGGKKKLNEKFSSLVKSPNAFYIFALYAKYIIQKVLVEHVSSRIMHWKKFSFTFLLFSLHLLFNIVFYRIRKIIQIPLVRIKFNYCIEGKIEIFTLQNLKRDK